MDRGITHIWLMDVRQLGTLGRTINRKILLQRRREMCDGEIEGSRHAVRRFAVSRSLGGGENIASVGSGCSSFNWCLDAANRVGQSLFVVALPDTYRADGHGCRRVFVIIPGLDQIACWKECPVDDYGDATGSPKASTNCVPSLLVTPSAAKEPTLCHFLRINSEMIRPF